MVLIASTIFSRVFPLIILFCPYLLSLSQSYVKMMMYEKNYHCPPIPLGHKLAFIDIRWNILNLMPLILRVLLKNFVILIFFSTLLIFLTGSATIKESSFAIKRCNSKRGSGWKVYYLMASTLFSLNFFFCICLFCCSLCSRKKFSKRCNIRLDSKWKLDEFIQQSSGQIVIYINLWEVL